MAQAGETTIQEYQGDDWDDYIQILDNGNPRDLTGYSARMDVRTAYGASGPSVVTLSTTNGRLALRANQTTTGKGYIDMVVANSVTSACPAGSYVFDLEIVNGAGKVKKYIRGSFIIVAESTTST
jgi:hypothetical protein